MKCVNWANSFGLVCVKGTKVVAMFRPFRDPVLSKKMAAQVSLGSSQILSNADIQSCAARVLSIVSHLAGVRPVIMAGVDGGTATFMDQQQVIYRRHPGSFGFSYFSVFCRSG